MTKKVNINLYSNGQVANIVAVNMQLPNLENYVIVAFLYYYPLYLIDFLETCNLICVEMSKKQATTEMKNVSNHDYIAAKENRENRKPLVCTCCSRFLCPQCEQSFAVEACCIKHMLEKCPAEKHGHICQICGLGLPTIRARVNHMARQHSQLPVR